MLSREYHILVGELWVQCQVGRVAEIFRPLAAPNSKVEPVTIKWWVWLQAVARG